ncbi:MAG: hypothetical protein PHD60_08545, partial [Clostridia bacterium]|nr:hypothetical protein [Clostridia bacterium]
LFDITESGCFVNPPIPLPNARAFSEKEILQMEKEVLGLYLSGHPLAQYKEMIKNKISCSIDELGQGYTEDTAILAGTITSLKRSVTKRGETMAYFSLEDLTGSVEALLFPRNLLRFNDLLQNDLPILVKARLSFQEDKPKIMIDNMQSLEGLEKNIEDNCLSKLYIKIPSFLTEQQAWDKVLPIIEQYKGNVPLYLYFSETKKLIKSNRIYWVNTQSDLLNELRRLWGIESVSIVNKNE